ncbi:MAG TPA: phosphomethylpyrimidine synthase ThiC, partial [bacterium]|nr:phosphomethylpyrimidine synthase ThiC [bacterium]
MANSNGNGKNSAPKGITRTPFPGSSKRYVPGKLHNFQVPMREIKLSPTKTEKGVEENPPLCVYDTSGAYTDLNIDIDLYKG